MLEGEIGICVRTFKTKLGDSLFLSKRCFLMEDLYITLYVNYVSVMYARVKKKGTFVLEAVIYKCVLF